MKSKTTIAVDRDVVKMMKIEAIRKNVNLGQYIEILFAGRKKR